MFNDIYQVNLEQPIKIGRFKVQYFAVKKGLSTELLLETSKGQHRVALCEMPDEIRELVLQMNAEIPYV